ncbi:hypothetical protein [Spiroplasma poulsonii]|uniref:Uncharacterized protein n=1 Tax=Spiroplasma poulsonii TaxID=2138 RepID=A0A2P6F8L5_9MOLU|nr:hypothetical protein [Spiroplasma poulsonii]PQM29780.1 hypothetical protein SMSRO_SF029480 [Spiroplasma poulsonii]
MREEHFIILKILLQIQKEQDIISKGKNWIKEELNVEKLSPVIIRKAKRRFLLSI